MAVTDDFPTPRRVPLVRIGDPATDLDDEATRAIERRSFRSRYAVVYVTDGPRVRLGIGWALLVAATLVFPAARTAGLAGLFGIAAGWAAYQIVAAWDEPQSRVSRWVAAAGAGSLSLASMAGVRGTGAALLLLVAASLVVGVLRRQTGESVTWSAGKLVIRAGLPGFAAAGVVLTGGYEIGAVITLLLLVAVYEASDYVIGSGASNSFEGPLAGIIFMAVVTFVVAELQIPPFEGNDAWVFGGLAAVGCPAGQLLASALLPSPRSYAPALRRIDSLLVLAPLWAWLVGLYIARVR